MKRVLNLSLFFVVIAMVSCGSSIGKKSDRSTTAPSELSSGKPIHLDKPMFIAKVFDFEKSPDKWIFKGDKPCLIDFYADWCGPCKMIAPFMEDFASTYKDQINVYKINVDEQRELSTYFGIQSIPAILFCPMKGQPQMVTGALPKDEFVKRIETILLEKKN
jgi:thioredoxin